MRHKGQLRTQRKAETRERLLAVARDEFGRKGFSSTSVEDIATAAGYTRGAFYSNFESKVAMFAELLRRDQEHIGAGFKVILKQLSTCTEIELDMIEKCRYQLQENCSFTLWLDAMLLANRDASFRKHFRILRCEQIKQFDSDVRGLIARTNAPVNISIEKAMLALLSLFFGVHLLNLYQEGVE
ncbi:TetR/AcrR family transcriptional regulator [Burkholderia sp. Bp9142]|uniref:TetR/AcrR family transcriptional regulator n=1 Tax=Burkholderia sp. Bp9142 TaxID=2184573 RepID=UPI000F5902E0|nr:TetR family transcriptional regulator [Burkholderia sp. Bp9142]RQR24584.1 TetR family transcriptional regulator [Burkholderia sp. Bp9142]